ncbi:ribonuclease H [Parachaetomium inaequale]|uniref:Ribonuclease H n=1 Tax=Parachaetomium inaequale TaxID=2588326 RepID=A0AAN6P8T0_9PEZI|nr:ribonuclease H [Parachaetomium inaequale]
MEPGIYTLLSPSQPTGNSPTRRLTRRAKVHPATLFQPEDGTLSPESHFPLQTVSGPDRAPFPRFINRFNSREMLLVVDGSCVNNGRHADRRREPVGGCSFIFKGTPSISLHSPPTTMPVTSPLQGGNNNSNSNSNSRPPSRAGNNLSPPLPAPSTSTSDSSAGRVAFPLEKHGPSGDLAEPTSNRAKLRAVIAALQFRAWGDEGWRRVVILIDLEYIVWGPTRWLPRWVARRWRKPKGRGRYGNRDLWEELQGRVEELRVGGCQDGGAEGGEGVERFTKLRGIMV